MKYVKSGVLNKEVKRKTQGSSSSHSEVLVTENNGRNKSKGQGQNGSDKSRSKSRSKYKNLECHYCGNFGTVKIGSDGLAKVIGKQSIRQRMIMVSGPTEEGYTGCGGLCHDRTRSWVTSFMKGLGVGSVLEVELHGIYFSRLVVKIHAVSEQEWAIRMKHAFRESNHAVDWLAHGATRTNRETLILR
ncbi:hypothetical protein Pint_10727 [Pistacia integerrima]|uniref:Uncharacterized protein n=1 Tax=Pistacia integerrima TaxID=434235 RepID=A0ACC0XK18_9ROSI|nr:hypothetical protein Pint_10727 [Pistacia integerrima]